MAAILIKKYGNRRLYDTAQSRYVTLEELAETIRDGADVRVVDAKTHADLTQATLTQIIIESRNAAGMLPVPLLTQLIRLGDDALAEFLGRYLAGALDMYLQARRGLQAYNPFAMWMPGFAAPHNEPERGDVADLRRELEELRREVQGKRRRR